MLISELLNYPFSRRFILIDNFSSFRSRISRFRRLSQTSRRQWTRVEAKIFVCFLFLFTTSHAAFTLRQSCPKFRFEMIFPTTKAYGEAFISPQLFLLMLLRSRRGFSLSLSLSFSLTFVSVVMQLTAAMPERRSGESGKASKRKILQSFPARRFFIQW